MHGGRGLGSSALGFRWFGGMVVASGQDGAHSGPVSELKAAQPSERRPVYPPGSPGSSRSRSLSLSLSLSLQWDQRVVYGTEATETTRIQILLKTEQQPSRPDHFFDLFESDGEREGERERERERKREGERGERESFSSLLLALSL